MAEPDDGMRPLQERQRQLEMLERLSQRFGQSLTNAMATAAGGGKQLANVLDDIGGSLAAGAAKGLVSGLQTGLLSQLQSLGRDLGRAAIAGSFGGEAFPFARGGVVSGGAVVPFASGGIVASPTYFPLGRGMGLMGEAGPEAVMPLARGPDGRLGIRADAGAPTTVTVNITATDLDSFKRSEAQVSAALARAVARGRRAL
ncbi:MAG: transfer agent orfg11 [Enterovirga sp.]|nr:transfer agent orfg11 [Enterovirga sp.]